ncbi:MAG: efflux transporter outer membrane subunit, partial [Planctomycetota bacterium]
RWLPILLLAGACKVGPDYEPPEIKQPDAWTEELRNGVLQGTEDLAAWWDKFDDPVLTELIQRADKGNLDLKIALSRIRVSRALLGIAKGAYIPTGGASASAEVTQPSENSPLFPPGIEAKPTDLYNLGFDATWELDVFGRIARNVEAQSATLGAQYEDYRDVRVVLYAEVARNYMDLRAFQARLAFARANVDSQQESLRLAQSRFKAGISPELDVAQAQSNLGDTESLIPVLEQGRVAAVLRLAVLLGVHPQDVRPGLKEAKPVPQPPEQVIVGLPANLLRQRPDLRASERQLAAETARIGVATAALYPQFSLNGFVALESGKLDNFLDGDSFTWGLGLPVRWNPDFGGQLHSQVEAQKERTEQALKRYELSILLAIEDVEGSLNRYTQEQDRRDALKRAVDAAQRTVTLSTDLYKQGLVDFQNVLDSQRSLNAFQDAFAQSEGQVAVNLVALYKSMGGGWQQQSEQAAKDAAGENGKKKKAAPKT